MGEQAQTEPAWVILEDDSYEGMPFIPIERDVPVGPDAVIVCWVQGNGEDLELTEDDRRRAQMIAAAPDMLIALQAMAAHARPSNWNDTDPQFPQAAERSRQAWLALDAAISLATGQ